MEQLVKIKEGLKKVAKKLLPAAAAIAVGMVFPPAAGAVASVIQEKLAKFGLTAGSDVLNTVSSEIVKRGEIVDDAFEKLKKDLLARNKEMAHFVTSAVEYSLRGLLTDLTTTLQELKNRQDALRKVLAEMTGKGMDVMRTMQATIPFEIPKVELDALSQEFTKLDSLLEQARTAGISALSSEEIIKINEHLHTTVERIQEELGSAPYADMLAQKQKEFEELVNKIKEKGLKEVSLDELSEKHKALQEAFNKFKTEGLKVLELVKDINLDMNTLTQYQNELSALIEELKTKGISGIDTDRLLEIKDELGATINNLISKGLGPEYTKLLNEKYNLFKDTIEKILVKGEGTLNTAELETIQKELNNAIEMVKTKGLESFEDLKALGGEQIEKLNELLKSKGLSLSATTATTGMPIPLSTAGTLASAAIKIPGLLRRLRKSEYKLDKRFKEGYVLLSKKLDKKSVYFMSLVQMQMAQTSSKYDINYDPDLYVERKQPQSIFDSYAKHMTDEEGIDLRNVFLVLANAGIGKTWLLAHLANEYLKKEFPVFYVSLRLGFEYQLESIFSVKFYEVPSVISHINDVTKKPVVLFLDGLDEVSSTERSKILRFVASMGGRKDLAVVLSCRLIDWLSDPAISDHFTELSRIIYYVEERSDFETPVSVLLQEFTPEEVKLAIEKYGLPELSGELLEFAKFPYVLSVFSRYYEEHNTLPDPRNIDKFVEFIASPKGYSIFNRIGIRDYARDIFLKVIDRFIEKEKRELPLNDLTEEFRDREIWARIMSSGILGKKETMYGTQITLPDLFGKYLVYLAVKRKTGKDLALYSRKAIKLFPELEEHLKVYTLAAVSGAPSTVAMEVPYKLTMRITTMDGKRINLDIPPGDTYIYRDPRTGMIVANINQKIVNLGFHDPTISRNRHLMIKYDGSRIYVLDMGSTNGTMVNGRKIKPNTWVEVRSGDIVMPGLQTKITI